MASIMSDIDKSYLSLTVCNTNHYQLKFPLLMPIDQNPITLQFLQITIMWLTPIYDR